MARAGSRRARNREQGGQAKISAAPAYITREIPFFEFATEEGLVALEDHADWIIQEIGVEFRDDPIAIDIWKKAGADVRGTRVRLPKGAARELCKTAPEVFTQHARNPEKTVKIGGPNVVFAPIYGAPFVQIYGEERRYGTIKDFRNLVRLTHMLPSLHHSGFVICEPCDVPVNKRHLDMLYAHMVLNDQPMLGAIVQKQFAEESVDMARLLFGSDFVDDNCVIMGNVNTNSPLLVDKVVSEAARTYCGQGQGLVAVPFILSGAMGPVTTAASIAQALAEAMMVCAFTQLIKSGAPFVLGNFLSSMNLRSGAPTFGMPEPAMSNYIIGQLARRLKLPLRCGGALTASKIADAQAAYESADSMHSTVMGGANFVLHSAGWLEGGLATGFEKLVLDADRLGVYQKMLGGIDTGPEGLAKDAYLEVEPAGHFLGSQHTMRHYETAFYEAELSDSQSFEQWSDEGANDALQRANKRWKSMLKDYEKPPIDAAIDEALKDYIGRKKSDRADAWY